MRNIIAFAAGALFGLGLYLSGMTDTAKVRGFLDFFGDWDATLVFVMGGAIVPMAIAWRFSLSGEPVAGGTFPQAPSKKLDRDLIAGALLFGVGWGLVGLCPGPALASITFGGIEGVVFLIAMLTGMWLTPIVRERLDSKQSKA